MNPMRNGRPEAVVANFAPSAGAANARASGITDSSEGNAMHTPNPRRKARRFKFRFGIKLLWFSDDGRTVRHLDWFNAVLRGLRGLIELGGVVRVEKSATAHRGTFFRRRRDGHREHWRFLCATVIAAAHLE